MFFYANDFLTDFVKQYGIWEPHMLSMFDRLLTPESVVLDIGAHIGLHSIYLGQRVQQVHAFEPLSETVRLLRLNIGMNNLTNVKIHPIGLGNQEKKLDGVNIPNNVFHSLCARLGFNC